MRPSRKEDAIGNLRPTGNAACICVPCNLFTIRRIELRTTIRETTEGKLDNNHLNINSQIDIGNWSIFGKRATACCCAARHDKLFEYEGGAGSRRVWSQSSLRCCISTA